MSFKSIFITGGAGYAGSCLVPELLKKGYKVTVYDLMYYTDNFLPKDNPNLEIIKGDIRDKEKIYTSCQNHDVFIHLACISNDASFQLDEKLSTSINLSAVSGSIAFLGTVSESTITGSYLTYRTLCLGDAGVFTVSRVDAK